MKQSRSPITATGYYDEYPIENRKSKIENPLSCPSCKSCSSCLKTPERLNAAFSSEIASLPEFPDQRGLLRCRQIDQRRADAQARQPPMGQDALADGH